MHRARAVVGIQAIEGAHKHGLARLVARVEEVLPVIGGRREVHQHHAALLVMKPPQAEGTRPAVETGLSPSHITQLKTEAPGSRENSIKTRED
jgi:hypothetical protein